MSKWRKRFSEERKEGLQDEPQLGKPKKFDYEVQLRIMEIAHSRPKKITHWSTTELAKKINKKLAIEISHMTVQRILTSAGLRPHQVRMWVNSQDPDFEAKTVKIVGLYLNSS